MERMLRRNDVLEALGISESTLYRWMDAGRFPRPVQLGPNTVAWPESAVSDWMESRGAGRGPGEAA